MCCFCVDLGLYSNFICFLRFLCPQLLFTTNSLKSDTFLDVITDLLVRFSASFLAIPAISPPLRAVSLIFWNVSEFCCREISVVVDNLSTTTEPSFFNLCFSFPSADWLIHQLYQQLKTAIPLLPIAIPTKKDTRNMYLKFLYFLNDYSFYQHWVTPLPTWVGLEYPKFFIILTLQCSTQ